MGRLTEKFKQLIGAKKTLPAKGPGAAENPTGFMEYNLNSRKVDRYQTKAYNMINSLPLSLEKTQEVLKTVLGEEKANEFIETCFSSSPFKTPVHLYIRNHKEILEGLSEEQKSRILRSDEAAARFAREEYAKGEASKFPRQEYDKILSGALRRGIKGLDPETELKVVEGFENALSPEQIDQIMAAEDALIDPADASLQQSVTFPFKDSAAQLKSAASEEIKNNPELYQEYQDVIDFAADHITITKNDVKEEYTARERDGQAIESRVVEKVIKDNSATFKNGIYNQLLEIPKDGKLHVLPKEKEGAADALLNEKITFSQNTQAGIVLMIKKMKEMELLKYSSVQAIGEDGAKNYAFKKLKNLQDAYKTAVESGDSGKILTAGREYKKCYEDMQQLYNLANMYFNKDGVLFPGNLDSVRNDKLPLELTQKLQPTAQINTVFLIYLSLGDDEKKLDEYLKDPAGTLKANAFKGLEESSYDTLSKQVTTFNDALDLLTDSGKFKDASRIATQKGPTLAFGRTLLGPTLIEQNANLRNDNFMIADAMQSYAGKLTMNQSLKLGYFLHNPKAENAETTLLSLLVTSDEDRDMSRILAGEKSTDVYGRIKGEPFDPHAYLKEKGANYEQIIQRGYAFIDRIKGLGNANFRLPAAIEMLQKNYFQILKACENDIGSPGYMRLLRQAENLKELLPNEAKTDNFEEYSNRLQKHTDSFHKYLDKRKTNQTKLMEIEQKRLNAYAADLATLKEKVYDPMHPDPMSIDWGAPVVSAKEFKAAAQVALDTKIEEKKYGYSVDEANAKILEVNKAVNELAADPVFRGFVHSTLTENKADVFNDKDVFKLKWENYRHHVAEKKQEFLDQLEETSLIPEINVGVMLTDKRLFPQTDEERRIIENKVNEGNITQIRDDRYQVDRENLLGTLKSNLQISMDAGKYVKPDDYKRASDIIILGMLTDPVMGRNFFDKDAGFYKPKGFDAQKMNKEVNTMRKQLLEDPVFLHVVSTCTTPEALYSDYKKARRNEVNRIFKEEEAVVADANSNKEKQKIRRQVSKATKVQIPEDTQKLIKETYQTLERLNKGHKSSKEMKSLNHFLYKLSGKSSASVHDFSYLCYFANKYHKSRQGVIFSPFTDKGKLRLDAVEKLVRKTNETFKQTREQIEKQVDETYNAMKKQQENQAKNQAKNPAKNQGNMKK